MSETERLAFACPRGRGKSDDIDLALLDPADEDDRRILIGREHPEFRRAIEDDVREIHAGGAVMSPRLHLAMHEIVANQLWADDPPEVWHTAQRLTSAGYDRHEVFHMLGSVVSGEVWRVMSGDAHNPELVRAALGALPESWEGLLEELPLERSRNRAERRAEERRRRGR